MTIFEMLEKLETEIVALRMRYRDLESTLENAHTQKNGSAPRRRKRSAAGSSKRAKAAKSAAAKQRKQPKRQVNASSEVREYQQLELAVPEPAQSEEQQGRALGKRQALGKSLLQLRKMSSWRSGRSSTEGSSSD